MQRYPSLNVLGGELQSCSASPRTGFFRNGSCDSGMEDLGLHVVCAEMTKEFLEFSKAQGNDLSTPRADLGFPGLEPGDRWCVCAARWKDAYEAGCAPPVVLEATHVNALDVVSLASLKERQLGPR